MLAPAAAPGTRRYAKPPLFPGLAKVRTLLAQRRPGHSLPQSFYTDPDIYAFDLAAIYGRSWILAGFEAEVREPESYLALTVGRSPVIVVRGADGILRGFFNSCRHRGSRLCADGKGKARRLICPYHQWSYNLDGSLRHAGFMGDGFDPTELGLVPIHVETVAGTVYLCLAETPPPFAPFRDAFEPLLDPHELGRGKLVFEGTLVEKANWKLVMENARECYHCAASHPDLAKGFPTSRHVKDPAQTRRIQAFDERMAARGLGVGPVEGDWWQASRFPLNDGHVSLSMDGRPACAKPMGALGDGDVGSLRWALEPHSFAHALGDYVFLFSAMPTGPEETVVTSKFMVHEDAVANVDYEVGALAALWTRTNDEDRRLAETNQLGVNSLGYRPGPYAPDAERLVRRFTDWYCRAARAAVEA